MPPSVPTTWHPWRVASTQTLSDQDRRTVARWALACAEHVLALFEADVAAQQGIRDAIARTRAYHAGESTAATEIDKRFSAVRAAQAATTPAGAAAARSVAQAAAVAHMGAHALGAAGYAAKAVSLASPDDADEAVRREVQWQLAELTDPERAALRSLPALGTDRSGPLGPGLLTQGVIGSAIRQVQAQLG